MEKKYAKKMLAGNGLVFNKTGKARMA